MGAAECGKLCAGIHDVLITILATLVVLSVLILVHEWGHFFAAKSVDIAVPRFSLGIGPKVVGFRRGETEYVLSALPLGGYVKMAGMEDAEMVEVIEGGAAPGVDASRHFDSKPIWARVWVVSAGVIMNVVFAWLVYIGLAFGYGERLNPLTRIAVPDQLPAGAEALANIPTGAKVVAVGDTPVEHWTGFTEALFRAPAGPIVVRFADAPPATLQLPMNDQERFELVAALQPVYEPAIGQIIAGSPAARSGLQPGDRIRTVAGRPIETWQEFVRVVRAHPERPLALGIERDGQLTNLVITPAAQRDESGATIGQVGVGYEPPVVHRRFGFGEAIVAGTRETWSKLSFIVEALGRLVSGTESARSVGSVLTIGKVSGDAARLGLEAFLGFMALFSINLAILNLLPIPILDGGHLLFLAIEALRGRPLSVEQRIRLSHVGLIVIVGIMLWGMTNDVLVHVLGI